MNNTVKGYVCGVIAAVSYGTNPLGALYLYEDGLRPTSVLFYRFTLGAVLLGVMLMAQHKSFRVTRREAKVLLGLGLLFSASSITYYYSFRFMAAGLASTILFFYPVMVAVIMALFFGERLRVGTILSIVLALGGIGLLYKGDGNTAISTVGMVLVTLSALTYALYIVMLNRSRIQMSSLKLTFYVLVVCAATNLIASWFDPAGGIQELPTARAWFSAIELGLLPTVISLVMMAVAVQYIGSTPTAIIGALEPLTAVVIGILVFGEVLTARLSVGILLILLSVMVIVMSKRMGHPRFRSVLRNRGHHRFRLHHHR